ncbi:STAS domain-containing protein [Spirochaeta dissipatitropha]
MGVGMKVINVPAKLTIQHISVVHSKLVKDIGNAKNILLHVGAIEEIDSSGIQLLYSVLRLAQARGIRADFSGEVTEPLEIALLSGGFCREVPRQAKDLASALVGISGGKHAG